MLRGMGFDNASSLYVAAGKIYKAEKYMAPLKQMFPRLETKDTLSFPDELAPFMVTSKPLKNYSLSLRKVKSNAVILLSRAIHQGWQHSITQFASIAKSL